MLNLVQLQERLKDVPMQSLMGYANGSNPQIPPFLALGELNRRKKMEESAAAEQAQQMEGAPTIKEQIEQSTGLLALQGARQKQMAQQQAAMASGSPMEAPNTTTSEPVQMASGGYLSDVVPRDFQRGGIAASADPMMLKKLMLAQALKDRQQSMRPGLAGIPVNNIKRENFAGGGIVAFNGEEDSYVETSPGFYQLRDELSTDEDKNIPFEQRVLRDYMRKVEGLKSLAEMKKEAGIEAPPTKDVEKLAALQAQKQRFEEGDTFVNRLLAADPLRIGRSMGEYTTKQEAQRKVFEDQIAAINDLRTQAEYDAKVGDVKSARDNLIEAAKLQKDLASTAADVGYKGKLGEQSERGKVTNFSQLMEIIDEAKRNPTPENIRRMNSAITAAGYVTYQAPRVELGETQLAATNARSAVEEARKALSLEGLITNRELAQRLNAARKQDPSGAAERNIRLEVLNQYRASQNPPLPPLGQLPSDLSPSGNAPSSTSSAPSVGLPPQAVSQLKEGMITTFANGQKWTLRNGKPEQVK